MNETNNMLNELLISTGNESHIVIGNDRKVTIPDELKRIAVQYDHNIETVTFDCPRYWDGHDMSQMVIYINYLCPNMSTGSYWAQNVTIDPDDETIMHFDWTISRNVTEKEGKLKFLVCVAKTDVEGNVSQHWHSELNTDMYITDGLEVEHTDIEEEYPDLITQILAKLQVMEKRATKIETLTSTELSGVYKDLQTKVEVGKAVLGDDLGLMVGDLLLVTDTGCLWEVIFDVSSGAEGGTDDTYKCIAVLGGEELPEGTMVFKGVVDTLPDTANEGEAYKLGRDVTGETLYEQYYFTYDTDAIGYDYVVFGGAYEIYNIFEEAFANGNTKGYLIYENGTLDFTIKSIDSGSFRVGFTNTDSIPMNDAFSSHNIFQIVIETTLFSKGTLVVFHNGEWV